MTRPTTFAGSARTWSLPGRLILVFIVVASLLGIWGLWDDIKVPIQVAGAGWALASALVWLAYGIVLIAIVIALQRFGRRPAWAVALAVGWGGFAVLEIAGRANTAIAEIAVHLSWGEDSSWTTWATAPLVEEWFKTLGLVLLIMIPVLVRFGPLDGLIFGALIGASFQVVENFVFTVIAISNAPTEPGNAITVMLFLRGGLGLFSHVVWSAVIGAAVGGVVQSTRENRARRIGYAVLAFVFALSLHSVTNWASGTAIGLYAAGSLLGLVVFLVLLNRLRRSEESRLVLAAHETHGWGKLPQTELEALEQAEPDGSTQRLSRARLRELSALELQSLSDSAR
jgi:protease PrsW